LESVLIRFLIGGALVSLFAAVGSGFQPKTFAGLFGSAPPIALTSLSLAFFRDGTAHVELLSRSMLLGAAALAVYSLVCSWLVRVRALPVVLSAVLSWAAWGLVAGVLFVALVGRA